MRALWLRWTAHPARNQLGFVDWAFPLRPLLFFARLSVWPRLRAWLEAPSSLLAPPLKCQVITSITHNWTWETHSTKEELTQQEKERVIQVLLQSTVNQAHSWGISIPILDGGRPPM